LRPSWISEVGIGLTRFLWATTNPRGDYTADPLIRLHDSVEREWQAGVFHLVTFTMVPEDFLTWSAVVKASDWWTLDQVSHADRGRPAAVWPTATRRR
jgi:hypothetical protein